MKGSTMESNGEVMYKLACQLYPICRSITGNGVRETLKIIAKELPGLSIHEVPSGTQAFDWVVPSVGIVLLIPFFFISVFVERWAFDVKRKLDTSQVRLWSWKANLVTYGIILCLLLFILIYGIMKHTP